MKKKGENMRLSDIRKQLTKNGYLPNDEIVMAAYGALHGVPLLVESDPGQGKTSLALAMGQAFGLSVLRVQFYEGLTADKILYDYNYQRQLLSIQAIQSTLAKNLDGKTINEAMDVAKTIDFYGKDFLIRRPVLESIWGEQRYNLELQEKEGLLKIAHSTQKAHLEVQLSKEGKVIAVSFLPVKDSDTVIPVTEESASRSSGAAPHPLFDKIKYLAGDYELYTGERNEEHHQKYMENLKKWCDPGYGDYKIEVLYKYLQENRLIHDLIERGIFSLDEKQHLTKKWENASEKLIVGDQKDAFIRFQVDAVNLWEDTKLQENYIHYYLGNGGEIGFCQVTGREERLCVNHPSKIRNSGDKAKMISSNDKTNFTYRGRFHDVGEAYTISYEASQKVHNALKWLIERQGVKVGDKEFVLWGVKSENVPSILESTEGVASKGKIFLQLFMEKKRIRQYQYRKM